MKLTRELIREHFGPDVKISSRFPFTGFEITTRTGGRVIFTDSDFKDVRGGADIWDGIVGLGGALWGSVTVNAAIEHVAHAMLAGRKLGVPIYAGETKHFFGLVKTPPPVLPVPSGVQGSQSLDWTAAHCRLARLLGPGPGDGIRIGACWENGEPLRYAGEDAEKSITGFGPSGEGKGTAFQIPAILESASSVTIDPSGQLYCVCAPELRRRGVRVIAIMPFTGGFPAGVVEAVGVTRCLNPMDMLTGEELPSRCAELAQLLRPEEKAGGGDPFWPLAARNLITMLIGCVKLFEHVSAQNLCEVYHRLGNVFGYARWILAKPDVPRFLLTQLLRWGARDARNAIDPESNRTLQSIVETALAELAWLGDDAIERALRSSSFAWPDLKNSRVAVFVLLPVNKLDSHKALLTLCCGAALMGLSETEGGRHRVLVTVDEAALLKYMPMLQRAYAESRKRGVQLSVWFQNHHQAEAIYGPAWKNMLSDIQIWLRPDELEGARFISEQIGDYTEVLPHFSHSPGRGGRSQESVSWSEQGRPVLFPHDVMALPKHPSGQGRAAILIAPRRSRNALQIWGRPWFDCPDLKSKGGIDPYHRHRMKGGGA